MTKEQAIEALHELDGSLYVPQQIALDMAIKALEQQSNDCKIFGTKENCFGGATENECEHCDYKIQKLEQQPSEDVIAIHTQGLDEGIRCAMCTNSMKSDSGCDGGCRVDEDMYKKVMDTIKNQMFSQPTSDDCVSRKDVLEMFGYETTIYDLPPVTPTHGTCKDCKHCKKDFSFSDKPMCLSHGLITVNDDFYCADFEKRGSEND